MHAEGDSPKGNGSWMASDSCDLTLLLGDWFFTATGPDAPAAQHR